MYNNNEIINESNDQNLNTVRQLENIKNKFLKELEIA